MLNPGPYYQPIYRFRMRVLILNFLKLKNLKTSLECSLRICLLSINFLFLHRFMLNETCFNSFYDIFLKVVITLCWQYTKDVIFLCLFKICFIFIIDYKLNWIFINLTDALLILKKHFNIKLLGKPIVSLLLIKKMKLLLNNESNIKFY